MTETLTPRWLRSGLMSKVSFSVFGKPISQPRHKITRTGRAYIASGHAIWAWKDLLREAADEAFNMPFTGPVEVKIRFEMPRPKSEVWKTKPMPSYPHYKKPDIDNMIKAVLDAITGTAFIDDSQVSSLSATKWVVKGRAQPETVITVRGI